MNPDIQPTAPVSPSPMQSNAPQGSQSSTMAAQFNNAIQFAQQNPTSSASLELMNRIKSGQMNDYMSAAGYNPSDPKWGIQNITPVAPKTDTAPTPSNVGDIGAAATSFGSDVSSSFKSAQSSMSDVAERGLAGKQSIGETILQGLGVGAKLGNDIIGSGIKSLINLNVPQPVQSAIGSAISGVIQNSPLLKAGVDAAKGGMDNYNAWAQQNPKEASTVSALINIPLFAAQFAGAGTGAKAVETAAPKIGEALDTAAQGVKNVAGTVATGAKNLATGSSATLPEVVGKITQASPEELPAATRALKSVDLTGSKTFSDVSSKLDQAIKANTNAVDTKLGASDKVLTPADVQKSIPVKGGNPITSNPVNDALKQLSDFYTKTNNPQELANIKSLETKFNSEGLTPKEVNDLARTHGQVLNAYNANGELASGLSRQAAENTRTALKDTARSAMPDAATQAIDKNTSDLIKTKGMVDDMATKVQTLENKLKSFTPLQKAGQFAGKAVNIATGGALKTFIKGLTGFGMEEGTTLNALQLQDTLAKNLKLLDKLNAMPPEEAASKIKTLLPKGK